MVNSAVYACQGKRQMTYQEAQRAARRMRRQDCRVMPYRCQYCRWWHVGD